MEAREFEEVKGVKLFRSFKRGMSIMQSSQ